MEAEIKDYARRHFGEIGGQLLVAAQNDQNRFEYYISIFLREFVREAHKIMPHGKVDRALNIYRRLFDKISSEVIIKRQ